MWWACAWSTMAWRRSGSRMSSGVSPRAIWMYRVWTPTLAMPSTSCGPTVGWLLVYVRLQSYTSAHVPRPLYAPNVALAATGLAPVTIAAAAWTAVGGLGTV